MPTITEGHLKAAVVQILKGYGAAEDEAPLVAESLVRAEMRGTDTHGLPYLKLLVERVEARMVSLPTRVNVLKDDGAMALLDGGNGIGQVAGWRAMELCIRKAREYRDRAHAGPEYEQPGISCFLYDARRGARASSASQWEMAMPPYPRGAAPTPSSGRTPFPSRFPPMEKWLRWICHRAVVARGKVRKAQRLGEKIPLGWALDESGMPTDDPGAALKGTLLPIGGPKGYGLALMVDVLAGMLSGATFGRNIKSFHQLLGPTNVGALTLAIDVERFMPLGQFKDLMKGYIASIRGSRKATGTARIYLPGEIESEKEKSSRERGIELKAASIEMVNQMLEKLQSPTRL